MMDGRRIGWRQSRDDNYMYIGVSCETARRVQLNVSHV